MHDDQRERLGHLLEQVLDLPDDDRAGYIAGLSGEDAEFREELRSLVEAAEPASRFFDTLAGQLAPILAHTELAERPPSGPTPAPVAVGDVVAQYEILERIGGGMGVVYRAHDLRLDRPVALKFLPPALAMDERARARLVAEARALSGLDHPNIGVVHEIAEADPGGPFIVLAVTPGPRPRFSGPRLRPSRRATTP